MDKLISVEQVKAGRVLLNWSQEKLAEVSGLSKPAIANLERRHANPQMRTIRAIQRSLETGGIEFLKNNGVRFRDDSLNVYILKGVDGIHRLWNDIYDTLEKGGERLISGVQEKKLMDATKERYTKAMKKFEEKNISSRALCIDKNPANFCANSEYRYLPNFMIKDVSYYIYENKFAMLLWEPTPSVIIIKNKAMADSYRKQFETQWKIAKKI